MNKFKNLYEAKGVSLSSGAFEDTDWNNLPFSEEAFIKLWNQARKNCGIIEGISIEELQEGYVYCGPNNLRFKSKKDNFEHSQDYIIKNLDKILIPIWESRDQQPKLKKLLAKHPLNTLDDNDGELEITKDSITSYGEALEKDWKYSDFRDHVISNVFQWQEFDGGWRVYLEISKDKIGYEYSGGDGSFSYATELPDWLQSMYDKDAQENFTLSSLYDVCVEATKLIKKIK